jgi:heavy metal sensor kinase
MQLTFRSWLTIHYVATLSCLLALTAIGGFYALDRMAQKKFDTALWMLGVSEAEAIAATLREHGSQRPNIETLTDSRYAEVLGYKDQRLEKYVTVIDDQQLIADYSSNLAAPLAINHELLTRAQAGEVVYQSVEVDGVGTLRIIYMPVHGVSVPHPFVVMLGLPESFVGSELRRFKIMTALALITLVLLTGASAMLLADRAISPIEKITATAESISSNNLQARLPEPRTGDQISRLAAVFNQMLARLEAAFEVEHLFTACAAHELRTPLTILKGEAQVTLRRRRSAEEYEAALKSSLEEIEKLVVCLDDLLLLARYGGNKAELVKEVVQLDEMIYQVAEKLRPLAAQKEIALDMETDACCVEGEAKALEHLLAKLLENALYYTPNGGRVTVQLCQQHDQIRLMVEDTGIGIKPEDKEHIFNCFYRSAAARKMRANGSGVGLALAAMIARLHDATIDVASEPGKGTRFILHFPAIEEPEKEEQCAVLAYCPAEEVSH